LKPFFSLFPKNLLRTLDASLASSSPFGSLFTFRSDVSLLTPPSLSKLLYVLFFSPAIVPTAQDLSFPFDSLSLKFRYFWEPSATGFAPGQHLGLSFFFPRVSLRAFCHPLCAPLVFGSVSTFCWSDVSLQHGNRFHLPILPRKIGFSAFLAPLLRYFLRLPKATSSPFLPWWSLSAFTRGTRFHCSENPDFPLSVPLARNSIWEAPRLHQHPPSRLNPPCGPFFFVLPSTEALASAYKLITHFRQCSRLVLAA